jgi:hypothetical protein
MFFNKATIDLSVVFIRPVLLELANDKKVCNSVSFKKDGKFIAIESVLMVTI